VALATLRIFVAHSPWQVNHIDKANAALATLESELTARTPAQAESTDDGLTTCPRHGRCNPRDCMFAAPYCLEAEQPPVVAAGEVSDDNLGRAVRQEWVAFARTLEARKAHWLEPYEALSDDMKEVDRRIGRALFNAGQASRNGEVAELKRELEAEKLKREEARFATEEAKARILELEKLVSQCEKVIASSQKARAVPSFEEFDLALIEAGDEYTPCARGGLRWLYPGEARRLAFEKLFASPPAAPDKLLERIVAHLNGFRVEDDRDDATEMSIDDAIEVVALEFKKWRSQAREE